MTCALTAKTLIRHDSKLDPLQFGRLTGALLLVSDQPMIPEGVKTEASDQVVTTFDHGVGSPMRQRSCPILGRAGYAQKLRETRSSPALIHNSSMNQAANVLHFCYY